ncbi:MAG TPA: quinolinate synthase NadA [Polyangiales bacterium]|nr:quinolinate synthase NadA [Polyangiales bacterium]
MQLDRSRFPSLVIRADGFAAQGAFAQAQAEYLEPDPQLVAALDASLERGRLGVVAHFYMDAELQGALSACRWPHVHVADSLQMADRALKMAAAGVRAILVLGVDFMTENVRAMLDAGGFSHVPVYRVTEHSIGCSLAESAEQRAYAAYLERASRTPRSLHVIYVNTSLRVKAYAQRTLPTITCTSSNVVPLVLQAFAQVPDLHVWFGPDTYMGDNLGNMLQTFAGLPAEAAAQLHPQHTPATLAAARERFHWFEQGVCIVHHMFGEDVVRRVQADYPDALVTAHLEVPGEMFALGFRAQQAGRGVVGSTSNILDFIARRVDQARGSERLQFVLGTEAGMATAIARKVQERLRAHADRDLQVEIVFPVASEAIAATGEQHLPIVPGVAAGEGCSTAGGCATCPYMKMNSLDALLALIERIEREPPSALEAFQPRVYRESLGGQSVAELGTRSIVRMREFHAAGKLPDELVAELMAQ